MRRVVLALLATSGLVGLTAQASAADLRRPMVSKAPVVAPVPYFTWTGLYIGGHVGYGWAKNDWSAPGSVTSHDSDGFLGGGQVGFNYQIGQWVLGLEADASWSDMKGSSVCDILSTTCHTDVKWLALVTGRLGWAAWDRALLYVKGGAAFAEQKYTVSAPLLGFATAEDTRTGWTIGAGLEYAFAPNWSAKVEYNYVDFGRDHLAGLVDVKSHINVVKFGVNYRFGGESFGPISARY